MRVLDRTVDLDARAVRHQLLIVRENVLEQPEAVARRAARLEISPDGLAGRIEFGLVLRIRRPVRNAKAYRITHVHYHLPEIAPQAGRYRIGPGKRTVMPLPRPPVIDLTPAFRRRQSGPP